MLHWICTERTCRLFLHCRKDLNSCYKKASWKWCITGASEWDAAALIIFHQCLSRACNSLYQQTGWRLEWRMVLTDACCSSDQAAQLECEASQRDPHTNYVWNAHRRCLSVFGNRAADNKIVNHKSIHQPRSLWERPVTILQTTEWFWNFSPKINKQKKTNKNPSPGTEIRSYTIIVCVCMFEISVQLVPPVCYYWLAGKYYA